MRGGTGLRPKRQRPDLITDDESADLLLLTRRMRRLRAVRAPFRLRSRVLSQIYSGRSTGGIVYLAAIRPRRHHWVTLASRSIAAALIAVLAGYSTLAVSAASLPDSPLYSLKLFVEEVRVATADAEARPQIYVEQAGLRVQESKRLIDGGNFSEAERTVVDAQIKLESARAAARQTSHPEAVSRAIASVQAEANRVAALSAPTNNSLPAGPAQDPSSRSIIAAPDNVDSVAAPDTDARIQDSVSSGSKNSLLAPRPASGFTRIGGANLPASEAGVDALSGASSSAPSGTFVPIDPSSTSTPSAASATATPRSPAAQSTGTASGVASPTPTRAGSPASVDPSPVPGPQHGGGSSGASGGSVGAPGGPFTQIPSR